MKILLDECVTKQLRRYLPEFDVYTAMHLGLGGVKNGKLLSYCTENGFDILLTIDKNIIFQQNLEKYPLTIVVLNSLRSKIEELISFIPAFKAQLPNFEKHHAYVIDR